MSPYENLPSTAFWKTGVVETSPFELNLIYKKKFEILPEWLIATAGSCFAQHISRELKAREFNVLDMEPPPPTLLKSDYALFGYSMYSARYGNIYTSVQLLQLALEAFGLFKPFNIGWENNNRYFDALRPSVFAAGFDSMDELLLHRAYHLKCVRDMFLKMDLLVFTLGLTECWIHDDSKTIYPTCPGTIAGSFDESYSFKNISFHENMQALKDFQELLLTERKEKISFRMLLTVSPVPLTATASGEHVLSATSYSKSVLRSVAGEFSSINENVDYFPSYEIITNPSSRSVFYESNLRSVRKDAVEIVMKSFFTKELNKIKPANKKIYESLNPKKAESDIQCEDLLLENFNSNKRPS